MFFQFSYFVQELLKNSEYNQLPTAAKSKAPNICQALLDFSELCNLKLMQTASETSHRHFQLLVKIEWENGVQLVEGQDNNEVGKSEYLLKPILLVVQICRSVWRTYKNVCVYSCEQHTSRDFMWKSMTEIIFKY